MKLDPDCMRDVLLYLAEEQYIDDKGFKPIYIQQLYKELPNYLEPDIYYAVRKLLEAGYIQGDIEYLPSGQLKYCKIYDITFAGQEFIKDVKSPTVWNAVKEKAKSVGGMSVKAMGYCAATFMKEMIEDPQFLQSVANKFI